MPSTAVIGVPFWALIGGAGPGAGRWPRTRVDLKIALCDR